MQSTATANCTHEAMKLVRRTMADLERQLQPILVPPTPDVARMNQNRDDGGKDTTAKFKVGDHFDGYPAFSIKAAQAVVDRMQELTGQRRLSIAPYRWKGQLRGVRFDVNAVFIEYVYSGRHSRGGTPRQGIKLSLARKPEFYSGPWPFRLRERQGYTHVIIQQEDQIEDLLRMVSLAWTFKAAGRAPRVSAAS